VRELLIEQFFLPFLVTYFRDSKMDGFSLMATPKLADLLSDMKVPINDKGQYELHKLSKESYLLFRNYFLEERMFNKDWVANSNSNSMQLLLSGLLLIMCKKVPTELGISKIDALHNKVKLLAPPKT
jgi:hypothetical protein